ncbi:MAG: hypothetical protein M1818_001079 [Claussenomyces sp. TS43310]|nr:MAG: hypothetical protein M1818_001079 [Claussenomyces sp. TS43310]
MPKLPKGFGRRKSGGTNVLEEFQHAPAGESSFRVFERPNDGGRSFDGGVKLANAMRRPNSQPLHSEDNLFEDFKDKRGSGGSITNTTSTIDNSSQLSGASTAPSSTDSFNQSGWQSPHNKPFTDIPRPPIPKSSSVFSLKNAGRTFSFGRTKMTPSPSKAIEELPSPIQLPDGESSLARPRAVTSSSYASTVTPPRLDEKEFGISLGGDFADMFSGIENRQGQSTDVASSRAVSQSPDTHPPTIAASARVYGGGRVKQPSPLHNDRRMEVEASKYTGSSHDSSDKLMSNASPGPVYYHENAPPVPQHRKPLPLSRQPGRGSHTASQRPGKVVDGRWKKSDDLVLQREPSPDFGDAIDEDAMLLKESISAVQRFNDEATADARVRDSWSKPSQQTLASESYYGRPLENKTSVSQSTESAMQEDSLFDNQIVESADLAERFNEKRERSPARDAPRNRVMTPAQFERYRQDQERMKSVGGLSKQNGGEEDEDVYDEEEDEAEKHRQLAKQRRKQEAHMAVYRQQMMKVTGEAPPAIALSRPKMPTSQSSPNLVLGSGDTEDEDEDEEVPLAILAAHGFPNKARAPGQLSSSSSNPNLRASSQLSAYPPPLQSVSGEPASGRLPVFARKLPQDPYFGAGLVNATTRESLAYGTGSGSVQGTPRGLSHGGLVGVIATEERSRAMRRGSPNPAGEYVVPINSGFDGAGIPATARGSASANMLNGMAMPSPGEQAQIEMAQQMQQFMQIQMQFMQMQLQNSGGAAPSMNGQAPAIPGMPRPSTVHNLAPPIARPNTSHQRAMSTLDPNAAPWMQQGMPGQPTFAPSTHTQGSHYAPSIAPSERSNIGQPGRYRAVSQTPVDKSRTNTMSGALQDWSENKLGSSTIKTVKKKGNVSDDDDEEGWEAMKRKREQKKSTWKSKKDVSSIIGF